MDITLNLGSLVFGILSWIIPGIALMMQKRRKISGEIVVFISLLLMGFSLLFQLMNHQALIFKQDLVAIMDTIDGVVMVSMILIAGTILSNVALLYGQRKNRLIG